MRRARSLLLMMGAAAAMAVPSVGSASHGAAGAECVGTVADGESASCEATFPFHGSGYVSYFESHGNVHELIPSGAVTTEWIDPEGTIIYRSTCTILGLSSEGTGPLDVQNATCANEVLSTTYVPGDQTLRVTAAEIDCGGEATECEYHGHLEISPDNALF